MVLLKRRLKLLKSVGMLCLGAVLMNTMQLVKDSFKPNDNVMRDFDLYQENEGQALVEIDETKDRCSPAKGKMPLDLKYPPKMYGGIRPGGLWTPNCTHGLREKVAVLVPYRDRKENLKIFLNHMHPFLQHQQIDYGVYIIEQGNTKNFNRGKLFNVGVVEVLKLEPDVNCFILHDIDKLPETLDNVYTCKDSPKHLMGKQHNLDEDTYTSGIHYHGYFGGVTAVSKLHYYMANGFSNNYWGWGKEDDEFWLRMQVKRINIHYSYDSDNAEYVILPHQNDTIKHSQDVPQFRILEKTLSLNGINTLQYTMRKIIKEPLFTRFDVWI
ncbi:unnamed protein product [Owenia fusiformis]|uniref:Beta-1,4-galactosyltransferase n=1 Tax=Owenia fusiformis TaxID=6347 RepID=A0A8J1XEX8_OWEFU|nr:unnamed protein product [Owenia fusiformis]